MGDGIELKIAKAMVNIAGISSEYEDQKDRRLDLFLERSYLTSFNFCEEIQAFTNENLKKCYEYFDFKDKRILTVCASGDHVLEAILRGAKEVDCFDINMFAFLYFDLKRAAIKALTYEEFLNFFLSERGSDLNFNLRSYSKLYKYLMPESKIFWDALFCEFEPKNVRYSGFILNDYTKNIKSMNSYFEEEKYYELKKIIYNCKVNFQNDDIFRINFGSDKKYDFIGLSNIYQRVQHTKKYSIERLIIDFCDLLKKDGIMIINYEFMPYTTISDYLKQELGSKNHFEFISFNRLDLPSSQENGISYCRRLK